MATGQITWEQFITVNNDARGVRYKFEDLELVQNVILKIKKCLNR